MEQYCTPTIEALQIAEVASLTIVFTGHLGLPSFVPKKDKIVIEPKNIVIALLSIAVDNKAIIYDNIDCIGIRLTIAKNPFLLRHLTGFGTFRVLYSEVE